jgi:endonuclease/exonuclease/phosphatase family metal-dependent hydrolase
LRAFLLGLLIPTLASCDSREKSPDWKQDNPPAHQESETTQSPEASGKSANPTDTHNAEPPDQAPATGEITPQSEAKPHSKTPHNAPATLRFVHYNVENWLLMDRRNNQGTAKNAPKPEPEKRAAIRLIAAARPDAVGLCEIGTAADLAEIQSMLRQSGVDLPHSHYTGGSDEVRHLGFLSRFPITEVNHPKETGFQLRGQSFEINRGILDVSVTAAAKPYRFLGVHLKSKREVDEGDQAEIRVHEARLLRRHVDAILNAKSDARLVVYGDFNDTRPSAAFKAVTGSYNDPGYLMPIPFRDVRGDFWTHHWRPHDIYSRIDFVLVSRPLKPEVDFRASKILDDSGWADASDHRALLAVFR